MTSQVIARRLAWNEPQINKNNIINKLIKEVNNKHKQDDAELHYGNSQSNAIFRKIPNRHATSMPKVRVDILAEIQIKTMQSCSSVSTNQTRSSARSRIVTLQVYLKCEKIHWQLSQTIQTTK